MAFCNRKSMNRTGRVKTAHGRRVGMPAQTRRGRVLLTGERDPVLIGGNGRQLGGRVVSRGGSGQKMGVVVENCHC